MMTIWTRLRHIFARSAPETAATPALRRKDSLGTGTGAWSWIPGWDGAWGGRSYHARIEAGYRRNAVAYRCVRLIADCAAALPLRLMRAGAAVRHPVPERLLRHPNPATSGAAFFDRLYTTLLLAGEAWLLRLPEDRPDDPQEFHLLPPDRMRQEGRGRGPWPARYVLESEGERRVFPLDPLTGRGTVLHLVEPHPRDPLTPLARAEVAADAVDVHNAAQAWNKALLDNAARPSGAFVVEARDGTPASLSESQFARLKADIETLFQGARNAGRPLLLEGGLKWQPMAFSPADMDFINLKHTAARDIALAFGVPPMLLGIPGDNTYSNYQEANRAFWRLTVLPLVKRVADELTAWLADALPADARLEPDRDVLARRTGERESFWREIDALSFLTPAEKRALAGIGELLNARAASERKCRPYERDSTSRGWETKGVREARAARFQELRRAFEKAHREGKRVKIWRTQNDDKVRESHKVMEGVAVPIDSPFIVNGERLRLPSDPSGSLEETANCRCFVEYADEGEARAITARKAISAHGEGKATVIVFTDSSEEVRTGGSRSWRNNNPGNLRQSSFTIRHGSLGEAGGFAVFASPQAGWDALFALFRGPTYSRLTLDEALARFAPPSENDTAGYQRFVRERMGFTGDETLAALTDGQIAKLIDAIRAFEGWREGNTAIRKRAGQ